MNSFFSIIIITLNREKFLPRAIESVQSQTFENWEVIVVDDGSEDQTERVVKNYQDSRIRFHKFSKNQGKAKARNYGVSQASGLYITFLDSDDEFYPETLNYYFNFLKKENYPVGLVYGGVKWYNEASKNVIINKFGDLGEVSNNLVEANLRKFLATISVCIHHKVFEKFSFSPVFLVHGDNHFFAKVATKFPFFHINEVLAIAHVHENNTRGDKRKHLQKSFDAYQKFFKDPVLRPFISERFKRQAVRRLHVKKFQLERKEKSLWDCSRSLLYLLIRFPLNYDNYRLVKNYLKLLGSKLYASVS